MARPSLRGSAALLGLALAGTLLVGTAPSTADATPAAEQRVTQKKPTAYGWGGAVASVDPGATAAGLRVLRDGGNAVDAAVATAAALGVTEPYSAGIGGGGYFVYYDARTRRVHTIDGRETAPASMPSNAFINSATGAEYPLAQLVTSGLSVGVPGTPATWERALQRWGRHSLSDNLRPAIRIAERGFVVDPTFRNQTLDNKTRFAQITPTAELFLPGGDAPAVGSVFRNPDLTDTYREMARGGASVVYRGPIASDVVEAVTSPPKTPTAELPVFPGLLAPSDLRAYEVIDRQPTKVRYRHLDVYGMAPSSSGGTTVGEALNILDTVDLGRMSTPRALHYYLDASALAFADRAANVGDPAFVDVPTDIVLSQQFADSRACQIPGRTALPTPTAPGDLSARGCTARGSAATSERGTSTTHLVTSDRWGNVVSYTLTIEQTGGSGIVVPGRGFLLNNELTDFSAVPSATDPNTIAGGKRPRSSMSPTIVLDARGKPVLAVGSPGGSTIITTVLQTLVNRIDLDMTLPEAIAAPRASHRNNASVTAEPAFIERYGDALTARDYELVPQAPGMFTPSEIGAVAALEFRPGGYVLAAAEPVRRGGGSAGVVVPTTRR
ncbi:MAG TPA: gamma-glutamyltransferase [Microlunatus sp.]|nr:gamma-glutamyltransferase [Microlunatus sp.]